MNKQGAIIGGSIAIALALNFALALLGDLDDTRRALTSLSPKDWIVLLGLSVVNYLLRFLRWERYIWATSQARPRRLRHCLVYLAGFALTATPAKAGEAIRSLHLRADSVPVSSSLSALAIERLMDLLAIGLLATLILGQGTQLRWVILVATMTAIIVLWLLSTGHVSAWALAAGSRLSGRTQSLAFHVGHTLSNARTLLRGQLATAGIVVGIVAWGCEGLGFAYAVDALGSELSWMHAIGIYGLAMLVGALSFIPAGLGSTEVAMVLLLTAAGLPLDTCVAATLVCRMATLWFAVLIGVGALLLMTRFLPKRPT